MFRKETIKKAYLILFVLLICNGRDFGERGYIRMWKIKNSQKLFYAAYFIYIAGMFMDVLPDILYVDTEMLKKTFKMISMVLLVIRFCFFVLPRGFDLNNLIGKGILKYFTVQKIILVIIFSFTLLLGLMSKNFYLLALIMFGLNMQEFRMRELFSVSLFILVFLTGMTILLCFLGGGYRISG